MFVQEIGTELKRLREQKGLTLEEVHQALKIRIRYLEAIEAGDVGALPGIVYARGFIKSYAEFLGINGQELLDTYATPAQAAETAPIEKTRSSQHSQVKASQVKAQKPEKSTQAVQAPKRSVIRPSIVNSRIMLQAVLGVAILGVVIGAYALIQHQHSNKETSNTQSKEQTTKPVAVKPTTPAPKPAPAPTPVPAQPATPPPPKAVIEQTQKTSNQTTYSVSGVPTMSMVVTTEDDCWLEVTADGKTVLSTIVKKGQTLKWQANKSLTLLTAKSPYLTVKINDQPVTLENLLRGYTYSFQEKS